jgi:hypothetical protein
MLSAMTKIVVATLNPKRKSAGRKKVTMRTLEGSSPTFGADFQCVFAKNVARARRDNKQVIGAPDATIAKRR